jgi:signal transduction histidine kinase
VMKERNRIAREIHDTLAQSLAAIGLHLAAIQHDGPPGRRERQVESARRLVETSLAEARRSVWDLHPQYLDQRDLISGLSHMATDLGENANVRIDIRTYGGVRPLGTKVERNVFRIAQEAVANAIRHAAAHEIHIEAHFDLDPVRFTVSDDGRGFDPASSSAGFGLTSMRERAAEIGAELHVETRPLTGTHVSVTVPVESPEAMFLTVRAAVVARTAVQTIAKLPDVARRRVLAIRVGARRLLSRSART